MQHRLNKISYLLLKDSPVAWVQHCQTSYSDQEFLDQNK